MNRKALIIASTFQVILAISIITPVFCQPIPPTPQSPLGGGFLILLGAGIVYGVTRYIKSKKK